MAGQWLLLLAVLAVAWLLAFNAHQNLANHGVTFGFGFLAQRSGFDIPFHLIAWNTSSDTNARALLVGVLNTLLVSAMGIVTASLLGVLRRRHAAFSQLAGAHDRTLLY